MAPPLYVGEHVRACQERKAHTLFSGYNSRRSPVRQKSNGERCCYVTKWMWRGEYFWRIAHLWSLRLAASQNELLPRSLSAFLWHIIIEHSQKGPFFKKKPTQYFEKRALNTWASTSFPYSPFFPFHSSESGIKTSDCLDFNLTPSLLLFSPSPREKDDPHTCFPKKE